MQLRVLAAGDCSGALALLREPGNGAEIHCQSFTVASEVIAQLDVLAPDLILIDADSTKPCGLELCRMLKEHPASMMLPMIVLSRSSKRRIEAFAAGADDFMTRATPRDIFKTRAEALVKTSVARRQHASAQLRAEIERHEELRRTFRRYVSPHIANKIMGDATLRESILATADIRTRATVMFADMRGFTSIAERMEPQEIVPLLNEYFSLLTDITFQHDGTVFHMAGDCLMVGFGVPLDQPDSPERAIMAAQEMLRKFGALAVLWKERHQIETGLGIGINEGDVIAGNVGSSTYMNYTIIGDTVNIASRLSQRARAGEMLFSRSVKESLDEHGFNVGALELPPMILRGRSQPIDIYCVPLEKRMDLPPETVGIV